ncbi:MAG: hypothetical protein LBJ02_11455 [Bifidobacteriaceae bacterium]|jgi:hypothetical protein|nr:hypothetical protein [Bifidobacteriaceae bacterium]
MTTYEERYRAREEGLRFSAIRAVEFLVERGRGELVPFDWLPRARLREGMKAWKEQNLALITMTDATLLEAWTRRELFADHVEVMAFHPEAPPAGWPPDKVRRWEVEQDHRLGHRISVLLRASKADSESLTGARTFGWMGGDLVETLVEVVLGPPRPGKYPLGNQWAFARYLGALARLELI